MSTTRAQETDLDHQNYSVNTASLKKLDQSTWQKTFQNPRKPLSPMSARNRHSLTQLRRTTQCRDSAELRTSQPQELRCHHNMQDASMKPTFFTSMNSTESIPPAPHLSTNPEPPDSDIAQLWDLVRLTAAQRPRQATSTMPSHEDNTMLQFCHKSADNTRFLFCHKLPDITPSEISIPSDPAIEEQLQKLQLGDEFCGEAFYGSIMDSKQVEAVACDMKYIRDQRNMEREITLLFFGKCSGAATMKALGYVEQQRELDPTSADHIIQRRHSITLPFPPSSENSTIFTRQTPIQSFPTDKDLKKSPRLFYLRLELQTSSLNRPIKPSSKRGSTHGGSSHGGSSCGGSSCGIEGSNTRTLSIGLAFEQTFFETRFFDKPKIPPCLRSTILPFLTEGNPYADFLRVVFPDPRSQYQVAREELAIHATRALSQLFSTPRAVPKANKTKLLQDTLYFELLCYEHEDEVWKVQYNPRSKVQSSQASSDGQKKSSQIPKPEPHASAPSFHLCSLGILNLTEAADVQQFSEFVYTILRWGLARHCPSHAFNLHQLSWQEGEKPDPKPKRKAMTSPQMNTYWSS